MTNLIITLGIFSNLFGKQIDYYYLNDTIELNINDFISEVDEYNKTHYYDGESYIEIGKKIDRQLHSTLSGKGTFIAEYSCSVGVDPYLVASVILLETGCKWNCSTLVKECNNVGGVKGKPSCNGGSYRKFNTLDDGIKHTANLLKRYIDKGYTTPEEINKKYATSTTWASKVKNYMKLLKEE